MIYREKQYNDTLCHFNPNHDPDNGRFASSKQVTRKKKKFEKLADKSMGNYMKSMTAASIAQTSYLNGDNDMYKQFSGSSVDFYNKGEKLRKKVEAGQAWLNANGTTLKQDMDILSITATLAGKNFMRKNIFGGKKVDIRAITRNASVSV
jgi:hypothetical protein